SVVGYQGPEVAASAQRERGALVEQSLAVMTRGLSKSYGPVRALWGLDLEVRTGEIFGFLGPNGSGKTTTIRCLLDLIRPSGGTVRVLGIDPQADPVGVRPRVGYLPGELRGADNRTAEGRCASLTGVGAAKANRASSVS